MKRVGIFVLSTSLVFLSTCKIDKPLIPDYKTQNVFIIVMDGARYMETWGDSTHQLIPYLANDLAPQGIVCTNFYNDGFTNTTAGHTALTTSVYQSIDNTGKEYPQNPSVFQYWLQITGLLSQYTWIITSKDKLAVLGNCNDSGWKGKYLPSTNCGVNGLGSGVRDDSITVDEAKKIVSQYHPRLMLLHFKEPDITAHAGDSLGYLVQITRTDKYIWGFWQFLESDTFYAGKTTVFITNDHGRHLPGVKDGYKSHGDSCEGCRHINLFAIGPDFKKGVVENERYSQIDIPITVAELLHFSLSVSNGKVIEKFFLKKYK